MPKRSRITAASQRRQRRRAAHSPEAGLPRGSGPVTPEGERVAARELYDVKRGIDLTHRALQAAIATDCPNGHAKAPAYCYPGTKGLCRERYALGRQYAVDTTPAPAPGVR